MDTTDYLAAWLVVSVLAAGALSWLLASHHMRDELRCLQAQRLLDALQRYSDWFQAQRLTTVFSGEGVQAAAALDEACTIRVRWFPELAPDLAELLAVHRQLLDFLDSQQALWLREPEHWLESEHDKRFMALWRQHRRSLKALLSRIEQVTSVQIHLAPAPRESTYA
jgi:hypothetical protein